MRGNVLFISHDASRTGAPLSLLLFLRWLKTHSDVSFEIILKNSGELKTEFEKISRVTLLNPAETGILKRLLRYINFWKYRFYFLSCLKKRLGAKNIQLVYANTIDAGDLLGYLSFINCPVVTHVRELESSILHFGPKNLNLIKTRSTHFIAVSKEVKNELIKKHGFPESKIDQVYNFISIASSNVSKASQFRKKILSDMNLPTDTQIVCSAGTVNLRKGPDLFVKLAALIQVKYHEPPVHLIWIGKAPNRFFAYQLSKMSKTLPVHFLGEKKNPQDYFLASDIFVLTSREDPFPRVCLEAASLAKPIVCFDQHNGAKELVENDAGFVVPYLNLEVMADKIVELLRSRELREKLGKCGQRKARNHHNADACASKILIIIKKYLGLVSQA